ncbi:TPA: DapH/DapD/GlmU-related protein [Serratia fonticola]
MFLYILKKVRPGKKIDKSITQLDMVTYLLGFFIAVLRGAIYRITGGKSSVFFLGKGTRIRFKSKITIGRYSSIGDYCTISGLSKNGLVIGERSSISSYCRVVASTDIGNLGEGIIIGNNVGIGEFSSLGGSGGLRIGDDTIIAQYFSAHPENHNYESIEIAIKHQGTTRAPIVIGNGCWIGSKVTILSGVTIGNGVVIGAGSVVTKDIADNAIAIGAPAKVVSFRV